MLIEIVRNEKPGMGTIHQLRTRKNKSKPTIDLELRQQLCKTHGTPIYIKFLFEVLEPRPLSAMTLLTQKECLVDFSTRSLIPATSV